MRFVIGGNLARSFSNAFSSAKTSLTGLKNETRQTQKTLDQLGREFRQGKISEDQFRTSTERLTRELGRLERAQKRVGSLKTTFSEGATKVRHAAGIAAVGTAAVATGLAYNSLNEAGDFESQMTKVGVKAEASRAEMDKLRESALYLGAETSLSSSQVAVAMDELAAKGFNTNKILSAMPGIIAAAEASGEDLGLTSEVVTSALNAFELQAGKANHVADVMAMSANRTAAGVADLGYSFKYAAPVAKTLGITLEELAASTGILVDKGLSGEQAGTSLRMALSRLAKPPKEAKKALDKLGISVVDKNKKFKSMAQLSEEWGKSTKKLTQTQKVQYAAAIFGVEAASGMLNLFSGGPEKINEMTKALENSSGAAATAAKAMKDNYSGSLEQLSGAIESAQIKYATPILPVLKEVFNGINASLTANLGGIEAAGERTARALSQIFEPLTAPIEKPVLTQDIRHDPEMFKQYQKDLANYAKFGGMDFGDKVVYMLDEAAVKIEKWLSGSGGDSMNKIFTKLGEIAAKAWLAAFEGTVKSTGSNLVQGNFAAAAGMGTLAWIMGGGALVRGAWGAGKWGYDKIKGRKPPAAATTVPTTPSSKTGSRSDKHSGNSSAKKQLVESKTTKAAGKSVVKDGSKQFFKRTLGPLGQLMLINELTNATDEVADWAFGHKKGSSKPKKLFSNPFDFTPERYTDTRVGAIPKLFGFGGPKEENKQTVVRSHRRTVAAAQPPIQNATVQNNKSVDTSGVNAAMQSLLPQIQLATKNFSSLAMYSGQASNQLVGPVTELSNNAKVAAFNFSLLTMYAGQASGQIAGSAFDLSNNIKSATFNFSVLTMYSGQASGWIAGAFWDIKTKAGSVAHNLDILTGYAGQASGWLGSLNGIQSAGERVIKALNNLERRINNIQLPSVNTKRVSYDG
nr:phage tail tape measure protein [Bacillus sp. B-jedd]